MRGGGRRPRSSGWTPTDQICCDRPWDWIGVCGSCIGDLPAANGRDASGALDACCGVGCAKSGPSNICQVRKKVDAQMPRDALSVARRLLPLETVLWGRGIVSRVFRCDSRKYMHIQAQYVHIPYIHTNTIIYVHIHTYTNWQAIGAMVRGGSSNIHADTCIYVHIHAYTYSVRIYFPSTYICALYVNILHIRSYTFKVKNGDLERVPKTNARILHVFLRICTYMIQYIVCLSNVYTYIVRI